MERKKINLGIASHFPRNQWKSDHKYLETSLKIFEEYLQLHSSTVSSALKNGKAFLKSIEMYDRDAVECVRIYRSVLESDPNNLNALVGMYEVALSTNMKNDYDKRVQSILTSDRQREALPKALLEIGLVLSLLIPKYKNEEGQTNILNRTQQIFAGEFANLEFQIEEIPMETDLLTNYHITHIKRTYASIHYFQEGLCRFAELNYDNHKTDLLIWKFFVAQAYNRFDHYISETQGSRKDRHEFSYKALELFCEIVTSLDPAGGRHEGLYVQRSLTYIGHILTSRKDLFLQGKPCSFVPDCFQQADGHLLRDIWDKPMDAFLRALDFGFDTVAYTRYAKALLHDNNFDECITYISDVFKNHQGVHWYAASIRLRAYKTKYQQCFNDAKASGAFSSLPRELLTEAEKDGAYCFDSHLSVNSLSDYATILKWLGTSPDGSKVTDRDKIYDALQVLNRVYTEEGCHTYCKVHKKRAECHADVGELDEAIKYMLWSLNSKHDVYLKPPISFILLIEYLLKKLQQDESIIGPQTKTHIIRKIKFFIEEEIQHCHEMIMDAENYLEGGLFHMLKQLLDKYDIDYIKNAEELVKADTAHKSEQVAFVKRVKDKYNSIFYFTKKCCNNYPDAIKSLLDLALELNFRSTTQTMVKMCLISLGKIDREWTRSYNRKLKNKTMDEKLAEMFSPADATETVEQYDYLIIHAPENKDWIFFKFLPEMEDRPKQFKGCVPDRDFQRDMTFEQNVKFFMKKTTKILLLITPKFFERVYEMLQENNIMKTLEELYTRNAIDVIAVFAEYFPLDQEKHRQLFQFENVKAYGSFFDWNYLRFLLVKQLPPDDTQRDPVVWKDAAKEGQIRPNENDVDLEHILPYGVPEAMFILYKGAFIVGYDGEKKIPRWAAHKIDRHIPLGTVSRKTDKKQLSTYHSDQSLPPQARSAVKDYASADITKGHMTPLADHSADVKSARETNIMTNIYPEVKNNFLWNRLEEHCRDNLTNDFETIYIISGTLFRPQEECESANIETEPGPNSPIEECTEDLSRLQIDGSSNQRQSLESPKKSRAVKTVTYEVNTTNVHVN